MTTITAVYEQPLNERVRLLLRLEAVFAQALKFKTVEGEYHTQMCLDALFSLLTLTNRYELRSELLKELSRIKTLMQSALQDDDAVSQDKAQTVLGEIDECSHALHDINSKQIDRMRNVEFLNIIKQRNIHETGSYIFEVPDLQFWLLQSAHERSKQVDIWLSDFHNYHQAVTFLLRLIRESAVPSEEVAQAGIYLKSIDTRKGNHQMLRVEVLSNHNVFPRISGGQHRFAIRFMSQVRPDEKPKQTIEDVRFKLQTCLI